MNILAKHVLLSLCLFIFPACVKQVNITSNTFADHSMPNGFVPGSSFAIKCTTSENHLFDKEIAWKMAKTLQKQLYLICDENIADYHLYFNYGIKRSKVVKDVIKYIPGRSTTTKGEICGHEYIEKTETDGTFVKIPEKHVMFTSHVNIVAYDAQQLRTTGRSNPLWQSSTTCMDDSSDLRKIIDCHLEASFKYFGKNTNQLISELYDLKN